MTAQEKLQHFYDSTLEDVTRQSKEILDEYQTALDQLYETHKEEVLRRADLELQIEMDKLERQNNKELSLEHIRIKRIVNTKKNELKQKLLLEIRNLLDQYMSTEDYQLRLISQIEEAKEFAGDDDLLIYIDPSDSKRADSLTKATEMPVIISEDSFIGGTRAMIPSRNILIDRSFQGKLEEISHTISLEGGPLDE